MACPMGNIPFMKMKTFYALILSSNLQEASYKECVFCNMRMRSLKLDTIKPATSVIKNFVNMKCNNKRSIPKGLLLTAFFLLGFLCFLSTTGFAQTLQPPPSALNWKSSDDATNILLAQVAVLNQQIPGIAEGTPFYDNTVRRIAYFKAIIMEISKGATVAQGLELSIPAAATLGFEKEASYTPKILLKALHTETRVMLTN